MCINVHVYCNSNIACGISVLFALCFAILSCYIFFWTYCHSVVVLARYGPKGKRYDTIDFTQNIAIRYDMMHDTIRYDA